MVFPRNRRHRSRKTTKMALFVLVRGEEKVRLPYQEKVKKQRTFLKEKMIKIRKEKKVPSRVC